MQSVALEEGRLELESPERKYEIYRQKEMDECESFKQMAQQETEALFGE